MKNEKDCQLAEPLNKYLSRITTLHKLIKNVYGINSGGIYVVNDKIDSLDYLILSKSVNFVEKSKFPDGNFSCLVEKVYPHLLVTGKNQLFDNKFDYELIARESLFADIVGRYERLLSKKGDGIIAVIDKSLISVPEFSVNKPENLIQYKGLVTVYIGRKNRK